MPLFWDVRASRTPGAVGSRCPKAMKAVLSQDRMGVACSATKLYLHDLTSMLNIFNSCLYSHLYGLYSYLHSLYSLILWFRSLHGGPVANLRLIPDLAKELFTPLSLKLASDFTPAGCSAALKRMSSVEVALRTT